MRVLVFLLISGLAHFLAARWLLATLPEPARKARRGAVMGMALLLSLLLPTSRLVASVHDTRAVRLMVALVMIELGAVIIALVPVGVLALASRLVKRFVSRGPTSNERAAHAAEPVAAAEPAQVHALVGRRQLIERAAGVTVFGATSAALGWGMVRGRHAFEIEEVVVRVKGWPRALEGYVIAQVSDVHVGTFVGDRELDEGFELVKKIRPDMIVATGDLVDFESDAIGPLAIRMAGAGARDGSYAILGNHDHYAGAADVVRRLRAANVHVLSNQAVHLRAGEGGGFALLGVDDLHGRRVRTPGFAGPDLTVAGAGLAPDMPRILLAHQPKYFHESAGRIDLQLSGHTHGGQINPGFSPASLVMEYVAGRYERSGSTLWVNRGFGVAGPPSRVGAPPEVTKIVLVAA